MSSALMVLLVTIGCAIAAPAPAPQAVVAAPVVAAPAVITASSSQYIARNYNGVVAAPAIVADMPYTYPSAAIAAPAVQPVYYI